MSLLLLIKMSHRKTSNKKVLNLKDDDCGSDILVGTSKESQSSSPPTRV